jgi:hypothetical protein
VLAEIAAREPQRRPVDVAATHVDRPAKGHRDRGVFLLDHAGVAQRLHRRARDLQDRRCAGRQAAEIAQQACLEGVVIGAAEADGDVRPGQLACIKIAHVV